MTESKDPNPEKGENSYSCWETIHNHSDKAVKACIWILAAMCVAALIVIIIHLTHPPTKLTKISEENPAFDKVLETKMLSLSDHEFVNNSCQVTNCTVDCRNTSRIYWQVLKALEESPCEKDLTLNIYNQRFPNSVLRNRWIPANKDLREVSISNSNFTYIWSEAFNSIDFTKTQVLTLVGVNISTLGNGVLLGFSKLRSLYIAGKVGNIDRCFFQPVQSSLVLLRLGAELAISGDINVFGISYLPKLEALDLSDNVISGPLTKHFFAPVPNLTLLTLSNSKITSINADTFDNIADKLELLDLSNNLLTTVDVNSMERILALGKVNVYLLGNDWYCDCDLQPLIHLHAKFYDRFGDIPYCKGPPSLYGVLFTNVTYEYQCDAKADEDLSLETTTSNILKTESLPPLSSVMNTTVGLPTTEDINNFPSPFRMLCMSVLSLPSDEDSSSSSSSNQMEYFLFSPPCHEFELTLLKNNSVQVVVEDADEPINIVWFSDAVESFVYTIDGITVDYNCEGYTDPYLIVDNLLDNSTYTFCLVPVGIYSITPFNCLPLHVPIQMNYDDTLWISADEKQFTVGIVCLIFTCSMLLGGVIAFFGIKAYPDLLEGSRHVLMVKKSDQTCYVSTITEGEYMINQTKNSLKKKGSLYKTPLPYSPFNTVSTLPPSISPPPPPLPMCIKSAESTDESLEETEDHYELPCIYNKTHECQLQCIPNKYAMSPMSPPPLPKRNSDAVLYSSNSKLISEKPHPKMSF